jgi:hypothetical protein
MSKINIFDNFDANIDNSQWFQIDNGIANANFGPLFNNGASVNSNSLFFTGNGNRSAATNTTDVSHGGTITFDLIFGNNTNGGENVDAGEDVALEYTLDGVNWLNIATYDQDTYTNWTRITQLIPLAAQSSNTQFRWRQLSHSGGNFDNWGLDNIEIQAAVAPNSTFDDFDPGVDIFTWSEVGNGVANNNFGGSGNSLFFDGGTIGTGDRFATTNLLHASSGGTITFDLIFGDGLNGGEDADSGEDVVLQYSADNGVTWTSFATYDTENYTSFTRLTENIPLEAQFAAVQNGTNLAFRWEQLTHSGSGFDNWALDNVEIQTAPALSSIIDDFDPYIDSLQWSDVNNGSANTNFNQLGNIAYGGVLNSNALAFSGTGERSAATNLVDTSNGGNVTFDLIVGNNFNGGENADLGEDVILQYSTDGVNWLDINTYNQDVFTNWTQITENIPLAAVQNGNAAFRFIQPNNSGSSFDEWAIDNVAIQETLVESNDTILDAIDIGPLAAGESFSTTSVIGNNDNIAPAADVDFIAFELNAGETVNIDIDANLFNSSLDSVLRLFNSFGNELAVSDDNTSPGEGFSFDSYLSYTAGVSGTYYVGVSSFNNFGYNPFVEGSSTGLSTGEYEITIDVV